MPKRINKKSAGIQVDATMEKAQVAKVDDTQEQPTPAELTNPNKKGNLIMHRIEAQSGYDIEIASPHDLQEIAFGLQTAANFFEQKCDDTFLHSLPKIQTQLATYEYLSANYRYVLKSIRELDTDRHEDEISFPASKIAKLVGVCPPNVHIDFDPWFEDFLFDQDIDFFSIGDDLWVTESAVQRLIRRESSFPNWVRDNLASWLFTYCREIEARTPLLPISEPATGAADDSCDGYEDDDSTVPF